MIWSNWLPRSIAPAQRPELRFYPPPHATIPFFCCGSLQDRASVNPAYFSQVIGGLSTDGGRWILNEPLFQYAARPNVVRIAEARDDSLPHLWVGIVGERQQGRRHRTRVQRLYGVNDGAPHPDVCSLRELGDDHKLPRRGFDVTDGHRGGLPDSIRRISQCFGEPGDRGLVRRGCQTTQGLRRCATYQRNLVGQQGQHRGYTGSITDFPQGLDRRPPHLRIVVLEQCGQERLALVGERPGCFLNTPQKRQTTKEEEGQRGAE